MDFKILLCEESTLVRENFKAFIGPCSCMKVLEAPDSQSALALYKEHQPNLIFIDSIIAWQNKINVVAEIKKFDPGARIIILYTKDNEAHLQKLRQTGACDFMPKPWQPTQFNSIIAKYFLS